MGNVLDYTYGFNLGSANNGNVASIANNINTARSQTLYLRCIEPRQHRANRGDLGNLRLGAFVRL